MQYYYSRTEMTKNIKIVLIGFTSITLYGSMTDVTLKQKIYNINNLLEYPCLANYKYIM